MSVRTERGKSGTQIRYAVYCIWALTFKVNKSDRKNTSMYAHSQHYIYFLLKIKNISLTFHLKFDTITKNKIVYMYR